MIRRRRHNQAQRECGSIMNGEGDATINPKGVSAQFLMGGDDDDDDDDGSGDDGNGDDKYGAGYITTSI